MNGKSTGGIGATGALRTLGESSIGALPTSRPLLATADELQCTVNRIESLADRVRGLLYGFGPSCDEARHEPQSLEDVLTHALQVAEQTEKTLYGIISRLNND